MTNREKYITKRDEYDLMMTINKETGMCAVGTVGGTMRDEEYCNSHSCAECIQKWLNQETDQPRPQWQDAMMKNFLRR